MPDAYSPNPVFTDVFPETSGNTINGLGETVHRRPTPFFWHPPERQTHGKLQSVVTEYHRQSPEIQTHYSSNPPGGRGPKAIDQSPDKIERAPAEWAAIVKAFARENEGDLVGIAQLDPDCVYQGYDVKEPWVVMIGVAMDHDELNQAPATFENPAAGVVVAREYNRAARACRKLANFILGQGYFAKAYQGPYASAINMIPLAIAAGLGELGKHGSMINPVYGSSFRLSAVTTDIPLVGDRPVDIGADDFCLNCQVCTRACPPGAIFQEKQMVRGDRKWYVDFDKCIPYFGETLACGICIARCPWSFPGTAPRLSRKMLNRRNRKT